MSSEVLKINKQGLLGEILVNRKLITPEKLEIALKEQSAEDLSSEKKHRRLGEILIGIGFISEPDLFHALSYQLGLKYLTFSEFPKIIPDYNYPTVKFMKQYRLVPIGVEDNTIKIAMTDPLDEYAINALSIFLWKKLYLFF